LTNMFKVGKRGAMSASQTGETHKRKRILKTKTQKQGLIIGHKGKRGPGKMTTKRLVKANTVEGVLKKGKQRGGSELKTTKKRWKGG